MLCIEASLLHGADREICCLGSAPLRVTIVIAYDLAPCKIRPPRICLEVFVERDELERCLIESL